MSDHCHDKSRRLQEPRSVPSLALAMASLTYKMCEFGAVLGKCQWNKRLGRSFALAWVPGFRHSLDSTKRMSSCAARLARRGRFDQRNHSEFFSSWRAEEISTGGQLLNFHAEQKLTVPSSWNLQNSSFGSSTSWEIPTYGFMDLGIWDQRWVGPGVVGILSTGSSSFQWNSQPVLLLCSGLCESAAVWNRDLLWHRRGGSEESQLDDHTYAGKFHG